MKIEWVLILWDGTKVSRRVANMANAVSGYAWEDIASIRVIDPDGIERTWCESELLEAGRYAELSTNVAEKCIWDSVENSLAYLYKRLRKKKIKECVIL